MLDVLCFALDTHAAVITRRVQSSKKLAIVFAIAGQRITPAIAGRNMDMPKVLDGCDAVDVIVVGANMEVVGQQSYILVGHIPLQQCALGHGTDHIFLFGSTVQ